MSCEFNEQFIERCSDEILVWLRTYTNIQEDSAKERAIVENYVELRCQGFPPSLTPSADQQWKANLRRYRDNATT